MISPNEENKRLKAELWQLRQTIIRVDPSVMHDGSFEEMFTAPINIIDIARELIENLPQAQQ